MTRTTGLLLGWDVKVAVGTLDTTTVGDSVISGLWLGLALASEGWFEGLKVVALIVGGFVGLSVGLAVGSRVGSGTGAAVVGTGAPVRDTLIGLFDGDILGLFVGCRVGADVVGRGVGNGVVGGDVVGDGVSILEYTITSWCTLYKQCTPSPNSQAKNIIVPSGLPCPG